MRRVDRERNRFKNNVDKLAHTVRTRGFDHPRKAKCFDSRKEWLWCKLRTFDKAFALFADNRNFRYSSGAPEENFDDI